MSAPGEKKDQKKEVAICAMLSAPSLREAAKKAGIAEATLYRWLKDDSFKNDYKAAKRELLNHAISRLQQSSGKAVNVLVNIAEDKNCPASARVSAAKTILETSLKAAEIEVLEERIEKLEKVIEGRAHGS